MREIFCVNIGFVVDMKTCKWSKKSYRKIWNPTYRFLCMTGCRVLLKYAMSCSFKMIPNNRFLALVQDAGVNWGIYSSCNKFETPTPLRDMLPQTIWPAENFTVGDMQSGWNASFFRRRTYHLSSDPYRLNFDSSEKITEFHWSTVYETCCFAYESHFCFFIFPHLMTFSSADRQADHSIQAVFVQFLRFN